MQWILGKNKMLYRVSNIQFLCCISNVIQFCWQGEDTPYNEEFDTPELAQQAYHRLILALGDKSTPSVYILD